MLELSTAIISCSAATSANHHGPCHIWRHEIHKERQSHQVSLLCSLASGELTKGLRMHIVPLDDMLAQALANGIISKHE